MAKDDLMTVRKNPITGEWVFPNIGHRAGHAMLRQSKTAMEYVMHDRGWAPPIIKASAYAGAGLGAVAGLTVAVKLGWDIHSNQEMNMAVKIALDIGAYGVLPSTTGFVGSAVGAVGGIFASAFVATYATAYGTIGWVSQAAGDVYSAIKRPSALRRNGHSPQLTIR